MDKNPESIIQLWECIAAGDQAKAGMLLANGVDPDCRDIFSGTTPLHMAITRGDIPMIQLLIKNGASVNHSQNNVGSTPLGVAAMIGNPAIVRVLLANGARLAPSEVNIVHELREMGLSEIVAMIDEVMIK